MKKTISRITTIIVAVAMMMLSSITASAELIRVAGGLYDTDSYKDETKFLVEDSCCVKFGYWNIYPEAKFGLTPYDQELIALYPFTVKEVLGNGWYKIFFGPVENDEAYIFVSEECCQKFFYVLSREVQQEETTTAEGITTSTTTTTTTTTITTEEIQTEITTNSSIMNQTETTATTTTEIVTETTVVIPEETTVVTSEQPYTTEPTTVTDVEQFDVTTTSIQTESIFDISTESDYGLLMRIIALLLWMLSLKFKF